jgi:hypothetical protein
MVVMVMMMMMTHSPPNTSLLALIEVRENKQKLLLL